jgi:hypothetical protein
LRAAAVFLTDRSKPVTFFFAAARFFAAGLFVAVAFFFAGGMKPPLVDESPIKF